MESEAVRRRMNMISSHFAPTEDISPTHLLPMNCSSSLNFVLPRCDNRMNFARQGSPSQAFFMRQVSTEQGSLEKPGMPFNCPASEAPMYSRPTKMEHNLSNVEPIQSPVKGGNSFVGNSFVSHDLPYFARPSTCIGRKKQSPPKESNETEWSPTMDVAESERNYVITLETPGVNVNDIRVEVNDQNLKIMGKRSTQWQCWSNDSISAYHRREILQGPYQVVWPLPSNVNRDSVSAEFLDGILQIIIPKV